MLNTVEVYGLLLPVESTKICSAFEHDVFEVMRETGVGGRIIFTTCFYSDLRLNAWLSFILAQVHL